MQGGHMQIYPSMTIYARNVVGLYRGNTDDMMVYTNNPMDVVDDLANQGVTHLHLVDMDSVLTGRLDTGIIEKIKTETPIRIQVGGGVRNMVAVEKYINAGADRVIIGNGAIKNDAFIKEAVKEYQDKITVAIDIKDGLLSLPGTNDRNAPKAVDFARKMSALGVRNLICTDVIRAGKLNGIKSEVYEGLRKSLDVNLIASGGVASLADVLKLRSLKLQGVIIGRAYYDGAVYIREAIRLAR